MRADGAEHDDAMAVLRRSSFLDACRGEPLSRKSIVETTGKSRTTVYRGTVELEEQGLLVRENGGYRTTAKGEALSHVVDEYLAGLDAVERLEPLFDVVDHPDLVANADLFLDADLTLADDDNVYRANDRVLELWTETDRLRMGATAPGSRHCLEDGSRIIRENGIDAELHIHPEAVPDQDHYESDSFDPYEVLACFDTSVSPEVPFTFVLTDDTAAVIGHNDVNIPIVLAETDDPQAYRWLEARYETCRENARPARAAVA